MTHSVDEFSLSAIRKRLLTDGDGRGHSHGSGYGNGCGYGFGQSRGDGYSDGQGEGKGGAHGYLDVDPSFPGFSQADPAQIDWVAVLSFQPLEL